MSSPEPAFVIRAATPEHAAELYRLATHLDSVNLPADAAAVDNLLRQSEASFRGDIAEPAARRYVFVLEESESQRVVGTSSIVAQLGRPNAPYVYFSVSTEEKYSRDLKLHFEHAVLRLGFSYDGPTELAGLVVDPGYRLHPARLGLGISYARFLYIAARRHLFQDELLAELLPPLEPDGTSHLWDALGRRFTNMSYREADRLSHENKDFIRDLFPTQTVYACLLSEEAQRVIGEVGSSTKGVEKMLRRIGFRYDDRVDPFDGGPHFVADTAEVAPIQRHTALPARVGVGGSTLLLAAAFRDIPPYFTAVPVRARVLEDAIELPERALQLLGAEDGEQVHATPLP